MLTAFNLLMTNCLQTISLVKMTSLAKRRQNFLQSVRVKNLRVATISILSKFSKFLRPSSSLQKMMRREDSSRIWLTGLNLRKKIS